MKKTLILLAILTFSAALLVGCDSGGGGKIEPISKPGGANAKTGTGPHPMPGGAPASSGN